MKITRVAFSVLLGATSLASPGWAQTPPAAPAASATAGAASAGPGTATPAPAHVKRHYRHRRHHAAPATPGTANSGNAANAPAAAPPAAAAAAPSPHAVVHAAPHPAPIAAMPSVKAAVSPPIQAAAAPAVRHGPLPAGLTPFGAIQAGNDDGSIPAWNGGLTTPPAGFVPGGEHINPFADEKPLFAISSGNMAQYAPRLTPGIQAMLKQYPGFRLEIYPSHRSSAAPPEILAAALANASTASLAPDGNSVLGAHLAIPFPVPHNGLEAIWNHLLRFRGYQAHFTSYAATPTTGGDYTLIKNETKLLFNYANGGNSEHGPLASFMLKTLAPPLYSGQLAVANDHVDPASHPRDAWVYSPGESRVRRAPEVNFDTPLVQADSLVTDDDLDIFNGSPERYNWQLIGRREIYVPYNTYDFGSQKHDYPELLTPLFVNPDLMRWELHRVWVVEATLKPGKHHIYPRRTYYFDEDGWEGLLADEYDRRGEVWRIAQGAPENFYEVPVLTNGANIFYDLQARRYHIRGMRNKDSFLELNGPKMHPSEFTADALREAGVR